MHNQGYIEQCIVDSFCVNHSKNNTIFESLEKDSFVLKAILNDISFFFFSRYVLQAKNKFNYSAMKFLFNFPFQTKNGCSQNVSINIICRILQERYFQ